MELLKTRRFLPLFLTQFLGAFNDNLFKNAMVMLITYKLAVETGENGQILVTIAAGIFILPFFLFSALAGQLADKYDRAKMTRVIKMMEIVIMGMATLGFVMGSTWFMMFVLFAMGTQSTFFGPIKYAILPQHLKENELLSGNAFIEAGTFLSILLGTLLGGLLVLHENGITLVSAALLFFAIMGYLSSRYIPEAPGPAPELTLNKNLITETYNIIQFSRADKRVFRCILGISWFWLVGATFLSQFPPYVKDVLFAEHEVVTLLLTVFSIGIAVGSLFCNKLLKGQVQSTYVPLAALGMTIFGVDLYAASMAAVALELPYLISFSQFLAEPTSFRILLDLFLIAIFAGLYIVPLYAILQHDSDRQYRARIIAANNVMNALFMVVSSIAIVVMLSLHFTIPQVFLCVAIANGLVGIYICKLLPDALFRSVARFILTSLYRVEIRGMEHFRAAGDRILLVANHTSFLDAALIAAYLPEKITFAINTYVARKWYMKPILTMVDALPLDPTNPLATKALIERLKQGHKCMIFPEGRITVTGSLMKIYEGPGMIADKADAVLLPIRIDGAQYTPLSRLKGKVRLRLFPKVTLTFLPPHQFHVPQDFKGRARRQAAGAELYDVMSEMMFTSSDWKMPLFASLADAMAVHGRSHIIVEDIERKPLNYGQFIARSFMLGGYIKKTCGNEKTIGLLLPSSVGACVTFFALHAVGKVVAMLNFTAGGSALASAAKAAKLKYVITSHRFVELAKLGVSIEALKKQNIQIIYLEDLRRKLGLCNKLYGMLASFMPGRFMTKPEANDPAIILFTSGSEGTPKGVVLSHANIQANRCQLASRIDFGPTDIVFNCLPMFHAFGLTGGTLLPLLSGIKIFFYPSPLHYRIVPELIYDTNATILFGTDTFLSGYARFAHPYDLHSIRYVFAGAEKLKEETRRIYSEKFGVRVFEGYGATETAPVLSTNTPMHCRAGTVGRFMPAIEHRLQQVPGIEEGGQLFVRGPNIMLGYLYADKPGDLAPPQGGWYDTGDIVTVDTEGYITIKGRTKRFAKIGGEMVSLPAVETAVCALWPEYMHAVVTVPDEKKGEQIVLITNAEHAEREALIKQFQEQGLPELALPKRILLVKEVPLLGTGKIDYVSAKQQALAAH